MTDRIARLWKLVSGWRDREVGQQVAALPYAFFDDELYVLLITSRGTGRWVLPKGWPHDGKDGADSAATEANEEAGLLGRIWRSSIGRYEYLKIREKKNDIDCVVDVYPLEVLHQELEYREKEQRNLKWFTPAEAAQRVHESDLSRLLLAFDPMLETRKAA